MLIGEHHRCANGQLLYWPSYLSNTNDPSQATTLHLTSGPYENYFYTDERASGQLVVTSPLPESNLTWIAPRLLFGFPAGDSGIIAYFAPASGENGTLAIRALNSSIGAPLGSIYREATSPKFNSNPVYGLSVKIEFNASATLGVAILGSIRTIRDFVGCRIRQRDLRS